MFSSTSSLNSASGSVRPQGVNAGWLSSLSTSISTSTDAPSNLSQRRRPLREMTLPITNLDQDVQNETDSIRGITVPQPVAAVASRFGVLGWFGRSSSISSGTGSVGAIGEPRAGDESTSAKTRAEEVEEVVVNRSEPVCPVPDREEALLERERQVESREKELDEREKDLGDRGKELVVRERAVKEGEEEIRRKIEEVEKRERELGEKRGEFETEREKWIEEKMSPPEVIATEPHNTPEWRYAMETLKKEMSMGISVERKKAEEREAELEMRVMKRVTEILALSGDEQISKVSGWRKKWDVSIKPLTRKGTSSTSSDFGI